MNAWLTYGGCTDLLNELYNAYNVYGLPFGNTTALGGWFRKEIKSIDDLKGLKFRCGGMARQVLAKLGVVPQQIPPADIYPALEKGAIDAAEWIGPYDDEKLGFVKIALSGSMAASPGLHSGFSSCTGAPPAWAPIRRSNAMPLIHSQVYYLVTAPFVPSCCPTATVY